MKNVILVFAMLVTAITSFAQPAPDAKTKADYLRKSRHQKTEAWIMLGSGVVLIGVGIAAGTTSTLDYAMGNDNANNTGANIIGFTGLFSTLGSLPMFISAGHNKRKAASLSIDLQKIPAPFQNNNTTIKKQPSLTFTIAL